MRPIPTTFVGLLAEFPHLIFSHKEQSNGSILHTLQAIDTKFVVGQCQLITYKTTDEPTLVRNLWELACQFDEQILAPNHANDLVTFHPDMEFRWTRSKHYDEIRLLVLDGEKHLWVRIVGGIEHTNEQPIYSALATMANDVKSIDPRDRNLFIGDECSFFSDYIAPKDRDPALLIRYESILKDLFLYPNYLGLSFSSYTSMLPKSPIRTRT